jgi:hypothetical protein
MGRGEGSWFLASGPAFGSRVYLLMYYLHVYLLCTTCMYYLMYFLPPEMKAGRELIMRGNCGKCLVRLLGAAWLTVVVSLGVRCTTAVLLDGVTVCCPV